MDREPVVAPRAADCRIRPALQPSTRLNARASYARPSTALALPEAKEQWTGDLRLLRLKPSTLSKPSGLTSPSFELRQATPRRPDAPLPESPRSERPSVGLVATAFALPAPRDEPSPYGRRRDHRELPAGRRSGRSGFGRSRRRAPPSAGKASYWRISRLLPRATSPAFTFRRAVAAAAPHGCLCLEPAAPGGAGDLDFVAACIGDALASD